MSTVIVLLNTVQHTVHTALASQYCRSELCCYFFPRITHNFTCLVQKRTDLEVAWGGEWGCPREDGKQCQAFVQGAMCETEANNNNNEGDRERVLRLLEDGDKDGNTGNGDQGQGEDSEEEEEMEYEAEQEEEDLEEEEQAYQDMEEENEALEEEVCAGLSIFG